MICKIWRFLFHFGEGITNWILALFTLHKLFILHNPFSTLSQLSARSFQASVLAVIIVSMLVSLPAFGTYRLLSSKANKVGIICMGSFHDPGFFQISLSLILMFGNFILPMITNVVALALIIRKMRLITKQMRNFGHRNHLLSFSEEEAAMLTIAIAHVALYTPFAVSWTVVTNFVDCMDPQFADLMVIVKRLFLDLSAGVHVWKLFFYIKRISIFRSEFIRLFCGKKIMLSFYEKTLGTVA